MWRGGVRARAATPLYKPFLRRQESILGTRGAPRPISPLWVPAFAGTTTPQPPFLRRQEDGFTFQVQHLRMKYLSWCSVSQALTRGIVVGLHQLSKPAVRDVRQVGLPGQCATHSSNGVLYASHLPWGVGITEEGLDTEVMELVVPCELSAVIEGDGLTPLRWQWSEHPCHSQGYGV